MAPGRILQPALAAKKPTLSQTRISVLGDDDVIMHRHPHQLAGLNELARDTDILAAWLWVARWVIVQTDDRSGVGQDRRLEDLPRLNDRRGQATDADLRHSDHRVGRIEKDHDELLSVLVGEVVLEHGRDVLGRRDLFPMGKRKVGFSHEAGGIERDVAEQGLLVGDRAPLGLLAFRHRGLRD